MALSIGRKNVLFTLSWKEQNCYDKLLYQIWFWDFNPLQHGVAYLHPFKFSDVFKGYR